MSLPVGIISMISYVAESLKICPACWCTERRASERFNFSSLFSPEKYAWMMLH
jgi:hypothetical protein